MLHRILDTIRTAEAPLSVAELARRVETPVGALQPMLDLLVRTGMLGDETLPSGTACATGCGGSCTPSACPFVIALPTRLEVHTASS